MDTFSAPKSLGIKFKITHFLSLYIKQHVVRFLSVVCLTFACFVAPVQAGWQTLLPDAQPLGAGELRRFGFLIYDAKLLTQTGRYSPDQPFALQLVYARTIAKDRIVNASLDEMQGLGIDVEANPQWRVALEKVLVDVEEGDEITGVYLPGQGAVFFHNEQRTGRLDLPLAQAFFSIWLDPKTSEPDLRTALIGKPQ